MNSRMGQRETTREDMDAMRRFVDEWERGLEEDDARIDRMIEGADGLAFDPDEDTSPLEDEETAQGAYDVLLKHFGPGPHPDGSPQSVHGRRSRQSLRISLQENRENFARLAQGVYDDWQSDDEDDIELGFGGICDLIASEIGSAVAEMGYDVVDGGQDGDDHAWIVAVDRRRREAFGVDIPSSLYERGGGYKWKRVPNVKFSGDDVTIFPVNYEDTVD